MKEKRIILNEKSRDCLNTIRLIAALQVMIVHAFVHLNIIMPKTISSFLSYFPGVPIFFVLSGFLIWQSIERSKSYGDFLKKRFLRIYPELWVGVIIEIVVILILYRKHVPIIDYILFGISQGTIFQFWTPDSLRNFGCGTPNGSLWTICMLIQFYLLVWFLHKFLHGKGGFRWGMFFIISLLISFGISSSYQFLPIIISKLLNQTIFSYSWMFIAGIYLAEKKDNILSFIKKYWWILIVFAAIYKNIPIRLAMVNGDYDIVFSIIIAYGWIGFAYKNPLFNVKTDISYGIYIYHMIIINVLIVFNLTGNIFNLIIGCIITCFIAYISTITVGKFSKFLKKRIIY